MAEDSDFELVKRAQQGDRAAFEVLVRRYEGRLFNTVFRLLGNKEDAQDVVQESFINAYQSLHTFRRDSQFFTWLYRIAYNTAVSFRRKKHGGPTNKLDLPAPDAGRKEEMERIQKAMDPLSPEHKMVLVLKEIEDKTFSDIAEILGLPIGTVRSRLHQARLELWKVLNKEPADPDKPADTPMIVDSGKQTDWQLIADSQHGDVWAFRQLMARYEAQLDSIVRELVAEPLTRASIREQIVAAVSRELATFPRDLPFISWLFQIAKRTAHGS